jgi:hypothetical protein
MGIWDMGGLLFRVTLGGERGFETRWGRRDHKSKTPIGQTGWGWVLQTL